MDKIHRKINLDSLPKITNRQDIDWRKSVGNFVCFEYGDVCGNFEIIDYKNPYVTIMYLDREYDIRTSGLITCSVGNIINNNDDLTVGTRFIDEKRDLTILGTEYKETFYTRNGNIKFYNGKYYKFKCNICGWSEGLISLKDLNKGVGCSCCKGFTVVEGINDITTTAPWMVKYFQGGYDEAKLYTRQSKQKIVPICPDCGRIYKNKVPIYALYNYKSLNCPCRDGWSYPNKFIYNLLEQLDIEFEPEKSFDWSDNKRYDEFLKYNDKYIVIENHGRQHYEENGFKLLELEKRNDGYKINLAKENGIDEYIILDCRCSELEFIKNSIMNSGLPYLLNFNENDINWNKCEEFALSNIVKTVCECKNNNPLLYTRELSEMFKLSVNTIINYLKKGNSLGWCFYNPKDEMIRLKKDNLLYNGDKPFICIETNNAYRNARICQDVINEEGKIIVNKTTIRYACRENKQAYGCFTFRYISKEEFNNIKRDSPELAHGEFFKYVKA